MVGVVDEQQQVAQADQGVRAVRGPGQRVRAAVHVAHHVDAHTLQTEARPSPAARPASSSSFSAQKTRFACRCRRRRSRVAAAADSGRSPGTSQRT